MKKTILISVLVLAVVACHRKNAASAESAESIKAKNEHAALVEQGRTVYTTKCVKCHGLKNTANYTADRWTNILKAMIPKAKLNDTEAQQVTAYVLANAKP